ncbi:hypothetical protein GQ457_05G024680 [Hibiscus cannabinus]
MDFQVVVLAGGNSKNLTPLISKDVPKPLLLVANCPILYYVLHQLRQSNLKDLMVVVEGEDTALHHNAFLLDYSAYDSKKEIVSGLRIVDQHRRLSAICQRPLAAFFIEEVTLQRDRRGTIASPERRPGHYRDTTQRTAPQLLRRRDNLIDRKWSTTTATVIAAADEN